MNNLEKLFKKLNPSTIEDLYAAKLITIDDYNYFMNFHESELENSGIEY